MQCQITTTYQLGQVEQWCLALRRLGLLIRLRTRQRPQLVNVHGLGERPVLEHVEVPHTDLQSCINITQVNNLTCCYYLSEVGTPTAAARPMTHLSEVTRVELVHQDPVVVLTTGVTTTT